MNTATAKHRRAPQGLDQHIQTLTGALQGIAESISMEPSFTDIPQFFHSYMYGDWCPFEEATNPITAEVQEHNQKADQLISYLKSRMPESSHRQVDAYIEEVNTRYTAELDYAYLVGFQTAFRMLLLGITRPEQIMAGYRAAAKR